MRCTRRRRGSSCREVGVRELEMPSDTLVQCPRRRCDSNHFALDSLVFDRIQLRAMPQMEHLWKKFSTWVKATQCPRSTSSGAIVGNAFDRARET
jgi:hypothetical protein